MELWIRSQDKETLKIVNKIYIKYTGSTDPNIKTYTIYSGDDEILGYYLSKERALEVLDEIENCLHQKFELKGSYEDLDIQLKTKMINGLYGYIYDIPEE